MAFRDIPIQRKLMTVILMTSSIVLLLTCASFLAYDFFTFRQTIIRQLSILGEVTATTSTAALAFDSPEDAEEILTSLKAEPHILAACLYTEEGKLFSSYFRTADRQTPDQLGDAGFSLKGNFIEGYQPVIQGDKKLGKLYIKSDLEAIYDRLQLYIWIVMGVIAVSFVIAYLISSRTQKRISQPIIALAETALAISRRNDYSVRAVKYGNDELGMLTDTFNQMLSQIRSFNQQLEQKVHERTIEMEAANKELESFSYSVSHDLRAPLRSIHGYMNIFAEDYASKLDDEAHRIMNIILENARKMGQLIDDLLEFSRMGRKELSKSSIPMKEIVLHIAEDLRKSEGNREIDLRIDNLPPVYADYITIQHVWVNLISNAFKYTRNKTSALIEIGATEDDEKITYFVKDNGAGFDMTYYDKLFGVFQRLHSHNEFEGTGVGLAIVQRIITRHNGKIWAEAKPEEGATFYFSLAKTARSSEG